ncbi:hypothetical protein ACWDRX_05070 [Streptomyces nigra]
MTEHNKPQPSGVESGRSNVIRPGQAWGAKTMNTYADTIRLVQQMMNDENGYDDDE